MNPTQHTEHDSHTVTPVGDVISRKRDLLVDTQTATVQPVLKDRPAPLSTKMWSLKPGGLW